MMSADREMRRRATPDGEFAPVANRPNLRTFPGRLAPQTQTRSTQSASGGTPSLEFQRVMDNTEEIDP